MLLLNWRDPWHPRAGGAELLTLRILSRLAAQGWRIEWFSALYDDAPREDTRDGIRFVRAGSQMTVHVHAFARYARATEFDVIVDQINTIPFYTPAYRLPAIAWFQQLAREVWFYEAPGLIGRIGYMVEPMYLLPYRNVPIITISQSTERSLREIGLRGPTRIIPMSTDERPVSDVPQKSSSNDIVVLGRVTPSKRIEESVRAAYELRKGGWSGILHIIGSPNERYRTRLVAMIDELDLRRHVIIHGKVNSERRRELLMLSSVLWMTSIREGWGLAVTEAAACGTPAVVYDVPGLRDAVKNDRTGYVVEPNPTALAAASRRIFEAPTTLRQGALNDAKTLSWELTAQAFGRGVNELLALQRP